MKITFKNEISGDSYETYECHSVLVDGKEMLSHYEGIEPEDARFYRCLTSPFGCEAIIKKVIEAVKRGEEVEIEHVEVREVRAE